MSTDRRLMDPRTGRITSGDEPCVSCPHDLNAHGSGVPGGYMKCGECDCFGFCDRASAWWLDEDDNPT